MKPSGPRPSVSQSKPYWLDNLMLDSSLLRGTERYAFTDPSAFSHSTIHSFVRRSAQVNYMSRTWSRSPCVGTPPVVAPFDEIVIPRHCVFFVARAECTDRPGLVTLLVPSSGARVL